MWVSLLHNISKALKLWTIYTLSPRKHSCFVITLSCLKFCKTTQKSREGVGEMHGVITVAVTRHCNKISYLPCLKCLTMTCCSADLFFSHSKHSPSLVPKLPFQAIPGHHHWYLFLPTIPSPLWHSPGSSTLSISSRCPWSWALWYPWASLMTSTPCFHSLASVSGMPHPFHFIQWSFKVWF